MLGDLDPDARDPLIALLDPLVEHLVDGISEDAAPEVG